MKKEQTLQEYPILFNGEMVRAILAGKKTQTRRLNGLSKINVCPNDWVHIATFQDGLARFSNKLTGEDLTIKSSNGGLGDRLYVRETFQTFRKDTEEEAHARFVAGQHIKSIDDLVKWAEMPSGNGKLGILYAADFGNWAVCPDSDLKPWTPSIFMPRKYSRIMLEITDIRVQRIQDISEPDAQAEGTEYFAHIDYSAGMTYRRRYSELWDKIYAERGHGWSKNNWVWVYTFKKAARKSNV